VFCFSFSDQKRKSPKRKKKKKKQRKVRPKCSQPCNNHSVAKMKNINPYLWMDPKNEKRMNECVNPKNGWHSRLQEGKRAFWWDVSCFACCHSSVAGGAQRSSSLLRNRLQLATSQSGAPSSPSSYVRGSVGRRRLASTSARCWILDYQVATQTAQLVVFGVSACVCVCCISCWTSFGRADTGTTTQATKQQIRANEGKSIGTIEQVREFLSCSSIFFISFQQ
jgi:hypothetical protein